MPDANLTATAALPVQISAVIGTQLSVEFNTNKIVVRR